MAVGFRELLLKCFYFLPEHITGDTAAAAAADIRDGGAGTGVKGHNYNFHRLEMHNPSDFASTLSSDANSTTDFGPAFFKFNRL